MQYIYTQTDRDWQAQWKCMEDLRHERMEHEASLVCPREATPLGEEVPKSTMALHRAAKLKEEAERLKKSITI
jgi:hypothetical protein